MNKEEEEFKDLMHQYAAGMDLALASILGVLLHGTPYKIFKHMCDRRDFVYLGYTPGKGWEYIIHVGGDEFLQPEDPYLPTFIEPTAVSAMFKEKVLVKEGKDLTKEEFKVQSALGTIRWAKIRKIRSNITLRQFNALFQEHDI